MKGNEKQNKIHKIFSRISYELWFLRFHFWGLLILIQIGLALDGLFLQTNYVSSGLGLNRFFFLLLFNGLFVVTHLLGNRFFETEKLNRKSKSLGLTGFLYSRKIQREVFKPLISDWQYEYQKTKKNKKHWKVCWVNIQYTYAFLSAVFQKSPLGDFIDFLKKGTK